MDKKKILKQKIDFESSLKELEKIAEKLESGELGLDMAIREYEKGMEYAKFCHEKLEEAERMIIILQKGDKGHVKGRKLKIDEDTGEVEDEDLQGSLL